MRSLLLVCLLFATLRSSASAQSSTEERARAHFQRGQELVREGRCDVAYGEFRAGYSLSQRPLFLFNMAECARQTGMSDQARLDYAQYLRDDPNGAMAATARARLQELGASSPAATASTPPSASRPTSTRAERDEAVDRGLGADALREPARPPALTSESASDLDTSLASDANASPTDGPSSRPLYKRPLFWVALSAVVVAGITTTAIIASQSGGGGGAMCTGDCEVVDFRSSLMRR